jgi:3-deoxy-D-manno-octulosonic-acid transferase
MLQKGQFCVPSEFDAPALLSLYRSCGRMLSPLLRVYLHYRTWKGKEEAARLKERYGCSEIARPFGPLIWVHAASVGETLAVLPLITAIENKGIHVLLTTGTVTSARLAQTRLGPDTIHQYVPLDCEPYIRRFIRHWQPDLALFVESELWPVTFDTLRQEAIPHGLINARMSERSFRGWMNSTRWGRSLIHSVLSSVTFCMAQTIHDADRFATLGAQRVSVSGNLKLDTPQRLVNDEALTQMQKQIGLRPVWLAASTHEGEDEAILDVHKRLQAILPNLLTFIAPRHPNRAESILQKLQHDGLNAARHSHGDTLDNHHNIYLIDTIGDMGLFYSLCPVCFVGGSFIRHGGQNPIEPVYQNCAVIHGPHVHNFTTLYNALNEAYGAICVKDSADLTRVVGFCLARPDNAKAMGERAIKALQPFRGALQETLEGLSPYLDTMAISAQLEGVRQ